MNLKEITHMEAITDTTKVVSLKIDGAEKNIDPLFLSLFTNLRELKIKS